MSSPSDPFASTSRNQNQNQWPCQCVTCHPCTNPTSWSTADAEELGPRKSACILCLACLRASHPVAKPDSPEPWIRPNNFDVDPGTAREKEIRAHLDELAAKETADRVFDQACQALEEGLPARWKDAALDEHFDAGGGQATRDIDQFLTALADPTDNRINLILTGPPGAGKTFAMHAVALKAVHNRLVRPYGVLRGTESKILRPFSTGFADKQIEHAESLSPSTVSIILIDDVGKGFLPNERERATHAWDILIDFAYENDIPMILTTNLTQPALASVGGGDNLAAVRGTFDWEQDGARRAGAEGVAKALPLDQYFTTSSWDRLIRHTPHERVTVLADENKRSGVVDGSVPRPVKQGR